MNMQCKMFSFIFLSQCDEMKQQLIQSQCHSIKASGLLSPQKTKQENKGCTKKQNSTHTEYVIKFN